jgi:hemerythrin
MPSPWGEWRLHWKEEYRVGIDEIDRDHEALVYCANEIEQALAAGERWSMLSSAIGQLLHLCRIHFQVEENLMRLDLYTALADHLSSHHTLTEDLKRLDNDALANRLTRERIQSFLKSLGQHFVDQDKSYAEWLIQRQKMRIGSKY